MADFNQYSDQDPERDGQSPEIRDVAAGDDSAAALHDGDRDSTADQDFSDHDNALTIHGGSDPVERSTHEVPVTEVGRPVVAREVVAEEVAPIVMNNVEAADSNDDKVTDVPAERTINDADPADEAGAKDDQATEEHREPARATQAEIDRARGNVDMWGRLSVDMEEDWKRDHGTPWQGNHQVRGLVDNSGRPYTRVDYYSRGTLMNAIRRDYEDADPVEGAEQKVHPVSGRVEAYDGTRGFSDREHVGLKPFSLDQKQGETHEEAEQRWFDTQGTPWSGIVQSVVVDEQGHPQTHTERFSNGVRTSVRIFNDTHTTVEERGLLISTSRNNRGRELTRTPESELSETTEVDRRGEAILTELEQDVELTPTLAMQNAIARYEHLASGTEGARRLGQPISDSEAHLSMSGRGFIKVNPTEQTATGAYGAISVAHIDQATGNAHFYDELVPDDEAIVLREQAERMYHDRQEAERIGYASGMQDQYADLRDPTIRGLLTHQHETFANSGLAERIIQRFNFHSRASKAGADDATSFSLRFFAETHGTHGSDDYLEIPDVKLVLEMNGSIDQKMPSDRHPAEWIELGNANFDSGEGFMPDEKFILQSEYDRYIAPLIAELRAAQEKVRQSNGEDDPERRELKWEIAPPAMVYERLAA